MKLLRGQLVRYCIVGGFGSIVDVAVLYAAMRLGGADPYIGRVISFVAAATFTWAFNRSFTFAAVRPLRKPHREWSRYMAYMTVGVAINFGVYAACISLSPFMLRYPALAAVAGTLAGLAFNYNASKRLVFQAS